MSRNEDVRSYSVRDCDMVYNKDDSWGSQCNTYLQFIRYILLIEWYPVSSCRIRSPATARRTRPSKYVGNVMVIETVRSLRVADAFKGLGQWAMSERYDDLPQRARQCHFLGNKKSVVITFSYDTNYTSTEYLAITNAARKPGSEIA